MTASPKSTGSIDAYILRFPPDVQAKLQKLRQVIHDAAPAATEAISYGIPTFKLNGNLVHFAAYKKHIGFYPAPSAIDAYREELSPYEVSKGAVQFPLNQPLPFELIARIVAFRVAEQAAK